jgi:hypothetical protein
MILVFPRKKWGVVSEEEGPWESLEKGGRMLFGGMP